MSSAEKLTTLIRKLLSLDKQDDTLDAICNHVVTLLASASLGELAKSVSSLLEVQCQLQRHQKGGGLSLTSAMDKLLKSIEASMIAIAPVRRLSADFGS